MHNGDFSDISRILFLDLNTIYLDVFNLWKFTDYLWWFTYMQFSEIKLYLNFLIIF